MLSRRLAKLDRLQGPNRIAKKLARFLSNEQLKQVHHVTLGFEDSFLLIWRDTNGKDRAEASGLPAELVEFIFARNRDVPKIRCCLGPYNESFFVHDGASYLWKNLPQKLVSTLQKNIKDGSWADQPRLVSLGADGNFLMITENDAAVWDLRNYKPLVALLEKGTMSEVHNLILHPYRFHTFVLQSKDGKLTYENIPPHELPGVQAMLEPILNDTKDAQTRQLTRRESGKTAGPQTRPSVLQQRAQLRREWSEHSREFSTQAKGVKLSFSLSVNLGGGLARLLG